MGAEGWCRWEVRTSSPAAQPPWGPYDLFYRPNTNATRGKVSSSPVVFHIGTEADCKREELLTGLAEVSWFCFRKWPLFFSRGKEPSTPCPLAGGRGVGRAGGLPSRAAAI